MQLVKLDHLVDCRPAGNLSPSVSQLPLPKRVAGCGGYSIGGVAVWTVTQAVTPFVRDERWR